MTLYVEQVQEQLQKTYESLALAGSFDKINGYKQKAIYLLKRERHLTYRKNYSILK